jgi:hypothetical protein
MTANSYNSHKATNIKEKKDSFYPNVFPTKNISSIETLNLYLKTIQYTVVDA